MVELSVQPVGPCSKPGFAMGLGVGGSGVFVGVLVGVLVAVGGSGVFVGVLVGVLVTVGGSGSLLRTNGR